MPRQIPNQKETDAVAHTSADTNAHSNAEADADADTGAYADSESTCQRCGWPHGVRYCSVDWFRHQVSTEDIFLKIINRSANPCMNPHTPTPLGESRPLIHTIAASPGEIKRRVSEPGRPQWPPAGVRRRGGGSVGSKIAPRAVLILQDQFCHALV